MQYKPNLFGFIAEMQLILCKDNANRMQYKPNLFGFIAEVQPILFLCKDKDKNCNVQIFVFF